MTGSYCYTPQDLPMPSLAALGAGALGDFGVGSGTRALDDERASLCGKSGCRARGSAKDRVAGGVATKAMQQGRKACRSPLAKLPSLRPDHRAFQSIQKPGPVGLGKAASAPLGENRWSAREQLPSGRAWQNAGDIGPLTVPTLMSEALVAPSSTAIFAADVGLCHLVTHTFNAGPRRSAIICSPSYRPRAERSIGVNQRFLRWANSPIRDRSPYARAVASADASNLCFPQGRRRIDIDEPGQTFRQW